MTVKFCLLVSKVYVKSTVHVFFFDFTCGGFDHLIHYLSVSQVNENTTYFLYSLTKVFGKSHDGQLVLLRSCPCNFTGKFRNFARLPRSRLRAPVHFNFASLVQRKPEAFKIPF